MTLKKAAAFLALGVLIGQISLIPTVIALADTKDANQLASVIQRHDIEPGSDLLPLGAPKPSTPDIYTIDIGENKLPTIIQVLPQDADSTSLYLNGTEVLRFRGMVGEMTSHRRAKAVADRLNKALVLDNEAASHIKPGLVNNQPVVLLGDEVLATVDAETAKAEKMTSRKLAYIWANRFRQPLGELALEAKQFSQFAHDGMPGYRSTGKVQKGVASWYGPGFHGRRTASGARYDMHAMTAAHRTLPFGTMVRVTNQRNQKSCVVRINDRGPFAHGRIIDLSKGAAQAIGINGVGQVTVEVVQPVDQG